MSSNIVGHLITKTITTLQHYATLHHTTPNCTTHMFYTRTIPTAEKIKVYRSLFKAYILTYPTKCKQLCLEELLRKWTEMKKAEDLPEKDERLMKDLTAVVIEKKESLLKFWSKHSNSAPAEKFSLICQTSTAVDVSPTKYEGAAADYSLSCTYKQGSWEPFD
jgi:hypothetical protein